MGYRIDPTGIVADANIYGIPCAGTIYGVDVIDEVIAVQPGMPRHEDKEGNEIGVVFDDEEVCGSCFMPVCQCKGSRYA